MFCQTAAIQLSFPSLFCLEIYMNVMALALLQKLQKLCQQRLAEADDFVEL
jgi:hypothetical protein